MMINGDESNMTHIRPSAYISETAILQVHMAMYLVQLVSFLTLTTQSNLEQ